jgi:hypothetical protein
VVLFAPYQTLVQTVITDDAVRKGLDIDEYDMTWQQVGYGVGVSTPILDRCPFQERSPVTEHANARGCSGAGIDFGGVALGSPLERSKTIPAPEQGALLRRRLDNSDLLRPN